MKSKFNLNNLTPTEFEEFCCDLLRELGFKNINWRKGTGLDSSPADSGRDIECELIKPTFGNKFEVEKWFVECKHYRKGVPPTALENILTWAQANRPDKVLIFVSNFLSNAAKDYIESYELNTKPHFKIVICELKDIEELTEGKVYLLNKYGLINDLEFINELHPLHLRFIVSSTYFNDFDYFIKLLDELDEKKRDDMCYSAYDLIIKPRFKVPITGKEKFIDLQIDKVDYSNFKDKCKKLIQLISSDFLIRSIINSILSELWRLSSKTKEEKAIASHKESLTFYKNGSSILNYSKEELSKKIKFHESHIIDLPAQTKYYKTLYDEFCNKVVYMIITKRDSPTLESEALIKKLMKMGILKENYLQLVKNKE